jgi:DNA-binding transcriptional ArsR family regulator
MFQWTLNYECWFCAMLATMNHPSIARVAGLIGEAGRIQMLTALLSGNVHPASELALAAGVSPQTASSHLAKLLAGGLIVCAGSGSIA